MDNLNQKQVEVKDNKQPKKVEKIILDVSKLSTIDKEIYKRMPYLFGNSNDETEEHLTKHGLVISSDNMDITV